MRCKTCHRNIPNDAVFCPYCAGRLLDGDETKSTPPSASFEYAAFISYRHLPRDQEVAKQVQQAIETYRLPRNVFPGSASGIIGKCFRDEDDLAVAHSLPERIIDALSKSSSLVVVCTPDTAKSTWVKREVEAFVEMHGRERVFAVLADGSSAKSIPEYLKTRGPSLGSEAAAISSPLAADMRPEASGKAREEMLRLIAAIAGCGFDDLKQRDRSRKRKRIAIATAAAAVVAAAIVAVLAHAFAASQEALASESRRLAAESKQLLSQGDRYGALEAALEALPESESSNDRPYVPEARSALEDALQIEFDENHPWNLRYALDAEGEVEALSTSPDEGWLAILDSNLVLAFHDIGTGKKISEVQLLSLVEGDPDEKDLDPDKWSLTPAGSRLIVWERDGSCVLCCIEVESGDAIWKYHDETDALSVSDDGEIATLLGNSGDSLLVAALHIPTGEWWGTREFANPGAPRYARQLPSIMGDTAQTLYVGFDNLVGRFDIVDNLQDTAIIPGSAAVHSVARTDKSIIALSSTLLDEDASQREGAETASYTLSALDDNMQVIWSNSGNWNASPVDSRRGFVGVDQNPVAEKFMMAGRPTVVVLAGSGVKVVSTNDGETVYEETFDSPVVGADPLGLDANDYLLYVTCADGTLHSRRFDAQNAVNGPTAFSYPGPVDNAHVDFYSHKGFFALARSLDDPRRIFVVQAETRTKEDAIPPSDYTLDELIGMAHDELDAVAQ